MTEVQTWIAQAAEGSSYPPGWYFFIHADRDIAAFGPFDTFWIAEEARKKWAEKMNIKNIEGSIGTA